MNRILQRLYFSPNIVIRGLSTSKRILVLNDLTHIKEGHKKRKRWGRGIGSGRGKNSGHGHQKSRSTPRAFEGGQTPLYKTRPKIGFHNHNGLDLQILNLDRLQSFIDMGRLKPKENMFTTMRDLYTYGLVSQVKEGIKLLAKGKEKFKSPIHLEVSYASAEAIKAVEAAGGTVTCVHFNRLALRAMMKPINFIYFPWRARPPPRMIDYYLNSEHSGYLAPEIQIRNIKLFGAATSEPMMRKEHANYLVLLRKKIADKANGEQTEEDKPSKLTEKKKWKQNDAI
eukprot:gene9570-12891_t